MLTTLNGAGAAVFAMEHAITKELTVNDLSSFHASAR
jgi:hypothetical protein